ncbi:hypothetical protein KP509_07G006300 [Ceratopteris richardii]|uniref:Transmembrane protein n=1 Tax=Ceratopteris richardii TaxID=49495 RepID=A0A8T2U766_CERRI|nr:hypothetical protein KP509_07G006300 [Ceratopteris richardii]
MQLEWPDYGIPSSTESVREMVRTNYRIPSNFGPFVVHCRYDFAVFDPCYDLDVFFPSHLLIPLIVFIHFPSVLRLELLYAVAIINILSMSFCFIRRQSSCYIVQGMESVKYLDLSNSWFKLQ